MAIYTSGSNQNSYITLSEANALLLTMAASFMEVGEQLSDPADEAYLLEAARDLETLWRWTGAPTDDDQQLNWPRKYVKKPGWRMPYEPGWSIPSNGYASELQYKIDWLSGTSAGAQYLSETDVPKLIKEAQALIALLRKKDGNLVGDAQGDANGLKIGNITVSYVNAIRDSADIHKRTSQLGTFLGDGLLRVR